MGLDIRLPIGLMFTLIGLLLAGYGTTTANDSTLYARSLGLNVNLAWGAFLILFGLAMLLPALRDRFRR